MHEGVDVLELAVDGGEADVGDLVHAAQLVHHLLADGLGRDLAFEGVLQVLLDLLADALELVERHRTLLAGADHTAQDLAPVEALAAAVLLDDDHRQALHRFIGGEALFARQADAAALLRRAGVDDLAFLVTAVGAFHGLAPHFLWFWQNSIVIVAQSFVKW